MQPFPTVGGAFRVLDAFVHVRMNDGIPEGLQRAARGDDLREHIRAVGVFVDHALDGFHLPADFAQARDERLLLMFRMLVMVLHDRNLSPISGVKPQASD